MVAKIPLSTRFETELGPWGSPQPEGLAMLRTGKLDSTFYRREPVQGRLCRHQIT
jgi:hypothetical protein